MNELIVQNTNCNLLLFLIIQNSYSIQNSRLSQPISQPKTRLDFHVMPKENLAYTQAVELAYFVGPYFSGDMVKYHILNKGLYCDLSPSNGLNKINTGICDMFT